MTKNRNSIIGIRHELVPQTHWLLIFLVGLGDTPSVFRNDLWFFTQGSFMAETRGLLWMPGIEPNRPHASVVI